MILKAMHMNFFTIRNVLIFLLVSLFIAVPLYADTKATAKGPVKARGNGIATVSGDCTFEVSGQGFFKVNALARVEIQEGSGEKLDTEDGSTIYINFSGKVKIYGSCIEAQFEGANINLRIEGSGELALKGVGFYVTGLTVGYWNPTEKTIIIFTS
jgi:hypothetical protein